jgi:hypothetical protein
MFFSNPIARKIRQEIEKNRKNFNIPYGKLNLIINMESLLVQRSSQIKHKSQKDCHMVFRVKVGT